MRQGTGLHGCEIEQPKILRRSHSACRPSRCHPAGTGSFPFAADDNGRQLRLRSIRPNGLQRHVRKHISAAVHDQVSRRRPDRIERGPDRSRTGAPPSTGILNSPSPLASLPPLTIQLPSGDQLAVPRASTSPPRARSWVPSAAIRCHWRFRLRVNAMAMVRPSGEIAAGDCSAPSEPFQISSLRPSRYLHKSVGSIL